jgi:DNA mismatch repair protein MutS
MATYTPMIQQYLKVKAEYQDAFLFFRLGDFYEMFFDDAVKASQVLEITLTSRDGGSQDRIPMCGVPYHAAPQYIEQLIEKGFKVAICEQTEDPKQAKGVVRREVVQLITPGTMMEGKGLNERENNYLASISRFADDQYGFAVSDLTTGESQVTITKSMDEVLNELATSGAREVVISASHTDELQKKIRERGQVTLSMEEDIQSYASFEALLSHLTNDEIKQTAARLFNYLYRTQKRSLDHLQAVRFYTVDQYMKIDYYSKRNLELTETIRSKGKKRLSSLVIG